MDNGRKGKQAGQHIYDMKVILGSQALAAYQTGEDLREWVP